MIRFREEPVERAGKTMRSIWTRHARVCPFAKWKGGFFPANALYAERGSDKEKVHDPKI
jgi:hypothetical protein